MSVMPWPGPNKQAPPLRRLAAGEGVNEAVDWPNVIEELQDVGLSELRACRSLLPFTPPKLLDGNVGELVVRLDAFVLPGASQ